jgi:hypothetical protein
MMAQTKKLKSAIGTDENATAVYPRPVFVKGTKSLQK